MARMVKPEIGILTAINPQHQDLFGSMETTMQAKYELMLGLTGRKIAIVNLDDTRTRLMGVGSKGRVYRGAGRCKTIPTPPRQSPIRAYSEQRM